MGTYNPLQDQQYATACIPCPPNSNTRHEASTSREECGCVADYYDRNASLALDEDVWQRSNVSMLSAVIECKVCPSGTECDGGATIARLPLTRGHWRPSSSSRDVRRCPEYGCTGHKARTCLHR